jgi:acetyl esterase
LKEFAVKISQAIILQASIALSTLPAIIKADEQPKASLTKSHIYKKTKQGDLEIVVHYPPGWKETDKRPAIVFGWANGAINQFEPQATHLASRGMIAARADY